MVIHIQIISRFTKMSNSNDNEFARGGPLTEFLNQQTVFDRNRNFVQILNELMKLAKMWHLGAMTQGCR